MMFMHNCVRNPDPTFKWHVAGNLSPPASCRAPDAMRHILLTNEGESVAEVGSCQMLLHMHRGPSKLVLTH